MVKYICPKCNAVFTKKYVYDKHMNRKTDCTSKKNESMEQEGFKCKCGKEYSRQDTLKKHIDKVHNGDMTYVEEQNIEINNNINIEHKNDNSHDNSINIENKNDNSHDNINDHSHDNDNRVNITIINNYANMVPFGEDGTNFLTPEEKMTVFQSTYLPLEALIYMVHLDDKRYAHHNVGYPDKNKKEGIVCNGRSWRTEEMNKIMHELRSSKSKDLAKLWSEVRRYLSSETIQEIKKRIERCNQICYDPKEWKSFAEHIKLEFYNKR